MLKRLLNSQAKNITFGALLLGVSALTSRLFGLVRTGLIAGHFGRGEAADIYFAAFRIPDFVYNLLIAGGVLIAFLPLFSEYYSKDENRAWKAANYILNVFFFLLAVLSLLLFIFTPQLIELITPGFSVAAKAATVKLTRLMFLSPLLLGMSSIFSGILQYFNRFLAYSLAPILYNLGIIFGIVFLAPSYGVFGVAMGVVAGAFLHLCVQVLPSFLCGYRYSPLFSFRADAVKKIFRLMLPRLFAIAGQQINLVVITAIASTMTTGALAIFTYASDLQYLPIGIVAIPFATASFPALSRALAHGKKEQFRQDFSLVFRQIVFLILPFALLLFILRSQVVRLILGSWGSGQFDWLAIRLTAASLGIFAVSAFASALVPLLSRAFFAFQDTKTPTIITVFSVLLNIALSISFVRLLSPASVGQGCLSHYVHSWLSGIFKMAGVGNISVLGLPLAFSVAVTFQFILLMVFLDKKTGGFGLKDIWDSLKNVLCLTLLMGLAVYFLLFLMNNFVKTSTVLGLLLQTLAAGFSGVLVYFLLSWWLKMPELKTLRDGLLHQFNKGLHRPM